jgi:hypothetical protein
MRSQTSVGTIRDALCVGGEERRRVVEAHVEAEEAHGFGRQSEEGSIIVTHDRTDPFEPPPCMRLCLTVATSRCCGGQTVNSDGCGVLGTYCGTIISGCRGLQPSELFSAAL